MFLEQFPDEVKQHGSIEVVCGSMFSGKTEELIRRLRRAEFANQKILLVKPKIDDRYHKENVVSHRGSSFEAYCVDSSDEILNLWDHQRVVARISNGIITQHYVGNTRVLGVYVYTVGNQAV